VHKSSEHYPKLAPFLSICLFALSALAGCQKKATTISKPILTEKIAAEPHLIAQRIRDVCTRQQADPNCEIPEFTDDQRLIDSTGSYGPYSYTFPDTSLAGRSDVVSFSNVGRPVAIIFVDTAAGAELPTGYKKLGLAPLANCVYLHWSGSRFEGYVRPAAIAGTPCAPLSAPPSGSFVPVTFTTPGNPNDVPAVARFHEGVSHAGPSAPAQPQFGVKCADRWCILTPEGSDTLPDIHRGLHPEKRGWAKRGWGDGQHLAVNLSSADQPLQVGAFEASVVPGPATEFNDSTQFELDTWYHAATAYFRAAPTADEYKNDWAFRAGENEIQIRRRGPPNVWEGRIRKRGGFLWYCNVFNCWHSLSVERKRHTGVVIPPSARFLWRPIDEGVWVRCADGCCKVSGT
jgi:hypothetical protein